MNTQNTQPIISEERRAAALAAVNGQDQASKLARGWSFTLAWVRSAVIALAIFMVARVFVIEAFKIPSGSMERTLMIGDFLLVNKVGYAADIPFSNVRIPALRKPHRGQIVVFQWPADRSKNFVKRVVGIPGDTLSMVNGDLFRNGDKQDEPYAVHHRSYGRPPGHDVVHNNWGPLVVPESNYFVLGDNRDNSLDSRYWGFVPDSLVRGSPLVVYYSYDSSAYSRARPSKKKGWTVWNWLSYIRWKRFGEQIK